MDLVDYTVISIPAVRGGSVTPGDISVQFVTANGATIPALGFGTYGMPRSDMLQ
jgi:hypothetical protein